MHPGSRHRDIEPYATHKDLPTFIAASAFSTEVVFTIAFLLLVVVTLLLYAQYSGAVRWLIAIAILAAIAYILVRLIGIRARDPLPFPRSKVAERYASGDLQSLAAMLDRASVGFKHSQLDFTILMKDVFLDKVRVSRSLIQSDIDSRMSEPQALSELIDDLELVEFLLATEQNDQNWSSAHQELRAQRGFAQKMERIMTKMEAWK
jgi:hypothetical protein